jgi:hypothetical protein
MASIRLFTRCPFFDNFKRPQGILTIVQFLLHSPSSIGEASTVFRGGRISVRKVAERCAKHKIAQNVHSIKVN